MHWYCLESNNKAYNGYSKIMENIWHSQGSKHKRSATDHVQEIIIPRKLCTGNNVMYVKNIHVLIILH